MRLPANIAAIDAGSNAIRLVIARVESDGKLRPLVRQRAAVRLGRRVFVRGRLAAETIQEALAAFRRFRVMMEQHEVVRFRAVATSAAREAKNRNKLIEQVARETGLVLEVISGAEEAALQRAAVQRALGSSLQAGLVADLGGGSLELSLLHGSEVWRTLALPVGTVRLMEVHAVRGPIGKRMIEELSRSLEALFVEHLPRPALAAGDQPVFCGGNAEALARIAPAPALAGLGRVDLRVLERQAGEIWRMDIPERMKAFKVRQDRAEVMGIAALIFLMLGRRLERPLALVPGVGVREGLLIQLSDALIGAKTAEPTRRQRAAG